MAKLPFLLFVVITASLFQMGISWNNDEEYYAAVGRRGAGNMLTWSILKNRPDPPTISCFDIRCRNNAMCRGIGCGLCIPRISRCAEP